MASVDGQLSQPPVDLKLGLCGNLIAPLSTCKAFCAEFQRHTGRMHVCRAAVENSQWPRIFGTSPWFDEKSSALLIFRGAVAIIFLVHYIFSLGLSWDAGFWLTKLTHWSLTMEFMYVSFAVYTTYAARALIAASDGPPKEVATRLPWFVSATWVLQHIAMPAGLLIMVLYWTLDNPIWALKRTPTYLGIFVHFINFWLLLADLFMGRNVFYLKHAACFFIYMGCFIVWSLIHSAARIGNYTDCKGYEDKRDCPIYSVLDWRKPTATGILAAIILLCVVPLCQFPLWWCIYKRRIADRYMEQSRAQTIGATSSDA